MLVDRRTLLARVGGPTALTAFWRKAGDDISRLDHDEPLLNRSPLAARRPARYDDALAMAQTLRRLMLGDTLSGASRERLAAWMVACRTGLDRLRGGLPATWRIGDKLATTVPTLMATSPWRGGRRIGRS